MVISAFNDIEARPLPQMEGIGGFNDLRRTAAMEIGAGNRAIKMDSSGIWLGAHKWASAPFRVNMQGDLVATSATISGAITATSGTIGGFTVGATYLYAGTGANTCGLAPADYPFWAGATYANRATAPFRVTPAGAVAASNLTITGGTIVGTDGNTISFYDTVGGTKYGNLGYYSASQAVVLISHGGEDVIIESDDSAVTRGDNLVRLHADYDDSSAGNVQVRGADISSIYLWSGSVYNQVLVDDNGGDTRITIAGSNAKTAILDTSSGYRALYCVEAPEVWFMDFCESKDKIDPLFLEVTEEPYHFIKCEGGEYQVWGKRKGMADKRFEEKTREQLDSNNEFWGQHGNI